MISFVMAVGRYDFIQEAIYSISRQVGIDWELLIFNNKGKPCKTKDSRIRIIDTPDWSPAKCYNEAKKLVKSDYILIATDDDIWFPERGLITYFHLERGADYFAGSCIEFDEKNHKRWAKVKKYNLKWQKYVANQISLPFVGYNWRKVPDFNEDLKICYDYLFNLECGLKGLDIRTTIMPLGLKRVWKGSLYKTTSKTEYEAELEKIRILLKDDKIRR